MGVVDSRGTVGFGKVDTVGVVIGVVTDLAQPDAGKVEHTVHEIGGEVVRGRRVDDIVTESAELFVVLPVDVREVADDGLFGGVLASPVTPPSILDTVYRRGSAVTS